MRSVSKGSPLAAWRFWNPGPYQLAHPVSVYKTFASFGKVSSASGLEGTGAGEGEGEVLAAGVGVGVGEGLGSVLGNGVDDGSGGGGVFTGGL
jgi:hypothetical protein